MSKSLENQSRRAFLGQSAIALAGVAFIPSLFSCGGKSESSMPVATEPSSVEGTVNSKFGGVQIGTITYSWRSMPGGLENIIKYCQQANISSIELMGSDLEAYLGAPENPMMKIFAAAQAAATKPGEKPAPRRMGLPQLTAEQQAEIKKYNEDMKAWRLSLDLSKVESARKLVNDAGIGVHIVKMEPSRMSSDEELDYAFKVAKLMGAKAVTDEISLETAERAAPFAEKNDMYLAFHNHMQFAEEGFSVDPILAVSPAVMLNFDAGHFFGSTGIHPNEMLKKYHDRIYSIHIKDKTGPTVENEPNTNQVWGQGQMPLEDLLLLIKKEKWPIYCDIELEYDVKPWSDAVREVGICVKYARQILM